jgi:hypothetical protein
MLKEKQKTTNRTHGFYWVLLKQGDWIIAEYFPETFWQLTGDNSYYPDYYFDEIIETKIIRKKMVPIIRGLLRL